MFYLDLVRQPNKAYKEKHDHVFGKIMMLLHNGPFRERPKTYAISFPEFNQASKTMNHDALVMRVFAPSLKPLNELARFLNQQPKVGGLLKTEHLYPEQVPEQVQGYVIFKRYRLGNPVHKEPFNHRKTFANQSLARLQLASASTGQFFCMNIMMKDSQKSDDWHPNSYGLSFGNKMAPIPVF